MLYNFLFAFHYFKTPKRNQWETKTIKTNKCHSNIRFKAFMTTTYNENFSSNQPYENGINIQSLGK